MNLSKLFANLFGETCTVHIKDNGMVEMKSANHWLIFNPEENHWGYKAPGNYFGGGSTPEIAIQRAIDCRKEFES